MSVLIYQRNIYGCIRNSCRLLVRYNVTDQKFSIATVQRTCDFQKRPLLLNPSIFHAGTITQKRKFVRQNTLWISDIKNNGSTDSEQSAIEGEDWIWDPKFKEVFHDDYILPTDGQKVLVIQPEIKWGPKKPTLTNAQLQLDEACTLCESLPGWKVAEKSIVTLKTPDSKHLFGSGQFENISEHISRLPAVTAVFVSVNLLSSQQLSTMQSAWRVPVYDRYTIVLQIFKYRARTKEAKLQIALAEIPYFRSRLTGIHCGTLDQQQGGLAFVGGPGEKLLETRKRVLQEKELKIQSALDQLRKNRDHLQKERIKKEIPSVAVLGYTNCGKTSLIKALTGDKALVPRNQLFATLDVTVHEGLLDSNLKVVYIDTVGFISDIPTTLIAAFRTTLQDALTADVIVHVRDVSHPDGLAQKHHVIKILDELDISPQLKENVIEVCNKVDLVRSVNSKETEEGALLISAVTGQGLGVLKSKIEEAVLLKTGRLLKRFKIPQSGTHLSWLYKEATVKHVETIPNDAESLGIEVIMTQASYAKFRALYARKGTNKSRDRTSE